MTLEQEYLSEFILKVEKARALGKRGVFLISEKIPDSYALMVKNYFEMSNPTGNLTVKKCQNCKGVWDILFYF